MTDTSNNVDTIDTNTLDYSKLQDRNNQTFADIKNLQQIELKLYDKLNNTTLTSNEKEILINKINSISQMRINLYTNLKDMYSSYTNNVSASRSTLGEQFIAINIVENELNESKKRLNVIKTKMDDKLRLVEFNTYYGKNYNAHVNIMINIVLVCIPILILSVLRNKGILPINVADILITIIIIIGCFIIGYKIFDLANRDNMNFDEYNWYNTTTLPSNSPDTTTDGASSDPWQVPSVVCVGGACCNDQSTYDETKNICVSNAYTTQQTTQSSQPESTTDNASQSSPSTIEGMIGSILSKYSNDLLSQNTQYTISSFN